MSSTAVDDDKQQLGYLYSRSTPLTPSAQATFHNVILEFLHIVVLRYEVAMTVGARVRKCCQIPKLTRIFE